MNKKATKHFAGDVELACVRWISGEAWGDGRPHAQYGLLPEHVYGGSPRREVWSTELALGLVRREAWVRVERSVRVVASEAPHECDWRCEGAFRGTECRCSCGGRNHGIKGRLTCS